MGETMSKTYTVWGAAMDWDGKSLTVESVEARETENQIRLQERIYVFGRRVLFGKTYPFAHTEKEAIEQYIESRVAESTRLRQKMKRAQLNIDIAREKLKEVS